MTTERKGRAREYLRVSRDTSGHERSVSEQHDDNQRAATEHGWTLGAPYADNDVSASRYARKPRGDFGRLLTDLGAGNFGADVLILWESSRGSRKVGEWVALIEACEHARVHIHVTSHGRTYDPANGRDRRSLLEDAVDSEYESSKISLRTRRSAAATAAAGRPNGPVPFGYRRIYDPLTRKLVRQEPDPTEAPIVREFYTRLHRGEALNRIASDLDARGVRTRSGKPWSSQHIRTVVLSETYAGQRTHRPGSDGPWRRRATATVVPAVWPALVSAEVWHTVHARLNDPARRTTRPGRAVHPYTMIVRCDVCGGPLTVGYSRRTIEGGEYFCRDASHVSVGKPDLETFLDAVICGYLARPDVIDKLRHGRDDDGDLQRVRGQLAEARAELGDLRAAVGAGRLSVASLVSAEPGIIARIEAMEGQERELSVPPALAALVHPGKDAKRRWKAAPMAAKREAAKLLLSPGLIGEVRVTRSPSRGHAVPVQDRVIFRRADGQP